MNNLQLTFLVSNQFYTTHVSTLFNKVIIGWLFDSKSRSGRMHAMARPSIALLALAIFASCFVNHAQVRSCQQIVAKRHTLYFIAYAS